MSLCRFKILWIGLLTEYKYQSSFVFLIIVSLCGRRCTRNQIEDYMLVLAQFIQALSMSVVVGMIYFRLEKDQQTIRDWFGLMYIIGAMYPYLVILDLIAVCKFTSPGVSLHRRL